MERDLPAEAVDLGDVVVGHGLRDDGAGDGTEGAIGNFNYVGDVTGYGVDACGSKALFGEEDGVEEFDVAGQHCGGHEEGVDAYFAEKVCVDETPVETERYFAEGEEVEEVDDCGGGVAGAEEDDKEVEGDNVVAVEKIGSEVEEADDHLADELGNGDVEENAGIGLEDSHVENEESEGEQEADIIDE